jgi:Flp pilus assembly protein TadD
LKNRVLLHRAGSYEHARKDLRSVLQLEGNQVTGLNGLAVYEGMNARSQAALRLLEQARAADPDHPLTWLNLGVAYETLGQPRQALLDSGLAR